MLNKEVKIAFAVGGIMLLICTIIILVQNREVKESNVNVKVLKLYKPTENIDDAVYRECHISTEDAIKVNKEFKRAVALNKNKSINKQIEGAYKIIIDDDYIAFDNQTDNIVYNEKGHNLYEFKSDLYEIIINACS